MRLPREQREGNRAERSAQRSTVGGSLFVRAYQRHDSRTVPSAQAAGPKMSSAIAARRTSKASSSFLSATITHSMPIRLLGLLKHAIPPLGVGVALNALQPDRKHLVGLVAVYADERVLRHLEQRIDEVGDAHRFRSHSAILPER